MSIIETLTEGIVNRNLQQEGAALLNKWTATGLLEGLNESQQANMAVLLENQAKSLLKEANTMSAGNVEGFAAVAFPIVRRVFAGLIANDLVSVQPMSLPSGLIFFLDFTFGADLDGTNSSGRSRFGNENLESIYGTDKLGSEITGGVNLVDARKGDTSGPRGMTGYAFASPSGSGTILSSEVDSMTGFAVTGISEANSKKLLFDADVLSLDGAATAHYIIEVEFTASDLDANLDLDNLSAIAVDIVSTATNTGLDEMTGLALTTSNTSLLRRLAQVDGNQIKLYFITTVNASSLSAAVASKILSVSYPIKDAIPAAGTVGAVQSAATNYPFEGNADIPEIDIKVDSIAITAQSKKLKAKWTPELGQDLNAYHNIDAEVELTSILSEQIALEIDREILADLVNGATAATFYWSRSPGLFVNRETGLEVGASAKAPDFTGTVSEWYETLIETINDVSAQIHRKTLRGGATHIVCSPEVANILEFTAGFRANVTADADKGDIGAVKVGSLNRKFDVIVDPYFPRNVVLVARIGSSFLESGYVYAPYVPLQTTPTIFGPEDFVPRKGVMTRYAKKMVRPDMYGLVIVRGLLGEEGT